MKEGKITHYAKFLVCDGLEKEIEKIEKLVNSGRLSADEEMILSEKMMQYKKEYVYLDELDGESE